jgi:protein-disulfide isomerase
VGSEDFQGPHCEELVSADGPTIDQLVEDGTLRVEYRPVAFLSAYSTRALNAAVCVNRAGGSPAFKMMHEQLFAHQPPEGSDGLSNAQLTSYADQALGGQRPAVATCIDDGTFDSWGSSATDAFSKATSNYPSGASTPTVLLDGTLVSATDLASYLSDPAAFRTAVEELAAG